MGKRHDRWAVAGLAGIVLAVALIWLAVGSGGEPRREQITVLAAASLTDVMREVAADYELQHPEVKVRLSFGPSNGLAQQILAGAPADIYLDANRRWGEKLNAEGLALETSILASNRLVVVVPPNRNLKQARSLQTAVAAADRWAIAGKGVPAGDYAEQTLKAANVWDTLSTSGRLVRGNDVRSVLAYVQRGEVDAGIVYATDVVAASQPVGELVKLEDDQHEPVVYTATLLKRAVGQAPRQFFDQLSEEPARVRFRTYGFRRPALPEAR